MSTFRVKVLYIGGIVFMLAGIISYFYANSLNAQEKTEKPSKLLIVWTSGDKEVANKMVFMYTYNSKKAQWWDEVRLLIWGPSSKLLSKDVELQEYIQKMKEAGVELLACKACADMYEVSDKLTELGVDVKYMGETLTDMLKNDWTTMTF